jgi:hypothetical protein
MNITIEQTDNGIIGIDEKGQRLAIFKWSIEGKKPKHGEVWTCTSRLYEPLELVKNLEEIKEERLTQLYEELKRAKSSKISSWISSVSREINRLT